VNLTPEPIGEHRCLLGEGPVWAADEQRLIYVDILRGQVHWFDLASGELTTADVGEPIGAAVPRERGGLMLATETGFVARDVEGELTTCWRLDENLPGNRMNDGKCDSAGRFWAGTQSDTPEVGGGGLYRLDPDGTATRVLGGIGTSNGLDWSDDGQSLYYIDTMTGGIDLFDFDSERGMLCGRRRFIDIAPEDGLPDGMTLDAEGGIWVALIRGSAIRRYSKDGTLDDVIRFPVSLVTSCAFGGPDLDELYVTTAAHMLSQPEPLAGALFRCRPGVKGRLPASYGG
jgi:sugar lactone lactonase YvrE